MRVHFIPEVERNVGHQVITRSMMNTRIVWEEWGKASTVTGGSGSDAGGNSAGGDGDWDDNPFG